MSKEVIEFTGIVEETFPNAQFRVRITLPNGKESQLLCHLAGRMRMHRVKILPGDRVKLELTPYDLEKGRIVYRFPPAGAPFRPGDRHHAPAAPVPPSSPQPPLSQAA